MEKTEIWDKYRKGIDYLNRKSLVERTKKNWKFYEGDQWTGLQSGNEKLPILNFIKPTVRYKVSSVAQATMVAVFNDMEGRSEFAEACKVLSQNFTKKWEQAKMEYNSWRILRAAAVQGDSYIFFPSDDVSECQIIANTEIMFGNEQEKDIQKQPYIIIRGRAPVSELIRQAKENGIPKEEYETIRSDNDTTYEIGNTEEVQGDGKCEYVIYMEMKDGCLHIARSTEYCIYEPLHDISAKDYEGNSVIRLNMYPIASLTWEEKPNDARGNSEVEQLIPNQIEINKTLARRAMSVKMTAFPRIAYDATAIQNAEDLEVVGASIAMNGAAGQIDNMIKYLNPASMSHDAQALLTDLLETTRNLAGAGDSALGDIDPSRASGTAIEAVRDQQALPLNEQQSAYKRFTEDLANLWFVMDLVYNPNGLIIPFDDNGVQRTACISSDVLMAIKPSIRIDVSKDNGWTKYAEQQELANHLNSGHITFEEYVELLPEGSPLPVNKMKAILERRQNVPVQEMPEGVSGTEGVQSALPSL